MYKKAGWVFCLFFGFQILGCGPEGIFVDDPKKKQAPSQTEPQPDIQKTPNSPSPKTPAATCPDKMEHGKPCQFPENAVCVKVDGSCWNASASVAPFSYFPPCKCTCANGKWDCEDTVPKDCETGLVPDGTTWYLEGTGTCDQEPAGGYCGCHEGKWECVSNCPDWCPWESPLQGEVVACTDEGASCRYWYGEFATCECVDETLDCY